MKLWQPRSGDDVRSLTIPVTFDFFESPEFYVADDCRLQPKLRTAMKGPQKCQIDARAHVETLKPQSLRRCAAGTFPSPWKIAGCCWSSAPRQLVHKWSSPNLYEDEVWGMEGNVGSKRSSEPGIHKSHPKHYASETIQTLCLYPTAIARMLYWQVKMLKGGVHAALHQDTGYLKKAGDNNFQRHLGGRQCRPFARERRRKEGGWW